MRTLILVAILLGSLSAAWMDGKKYCNYKDYTTTSTCAGCYNRDGHFGLKAKYLSAGSCVDRVNTLKTDMEYYPRGMDDTAYVTGTLYAQSPKEWQCKPSKMVEYNSTDGTVISCAAITAAKSANHCVAFAGNANGGRTVGCSLCASGYTHDTGTGGVVAGISAAYIGAAVTDQCALHATTAANCVASWMNKDKCDVCDMGYSVSWSQAWILGGTHTATTGVCAANSNDRYCEATKTNSTGECLACVRGYYFNGNKCQTGALQAPAPKAYDFCMETASDSSCLACFNDGNSTEGFKQLSAAGGGGNCQTKMTAGNFPSAAIYGSGKYTGTGAHLKDSFFCPSGQTFNFNADPKKSTCATTSSPIADCLYHAKGTGALECVVCKDGKIQKDAAGTACKAGTTTNAKNYESSTHVHECNTDYVKSAALTCKAWKASTTKTLDANCREIDTYGSTDVCVKCKWGYYFSGAWCAKGTAKAGSSTSTTSGTTSSTSSTTAKSAASIFTAGIVLVIAAAFN
jgi:hypothetical protein